MELEHGNLVESDLGRWGIPDANRLFRLGAKLSGGGAHISRTMMLSEITRLLSVVPAGADMAEYRAAVIDRNALSKVTESTRRRTYRHLRELYGLDPSIPLFLLLRQLTQVDPQSTPLIAMLIAWARDPLFRSTTAAILSARLEQEVSTDDLEKVATPLLSKQYNAFCIHGIAKNAASSWSQTGHLQGRVNKIRQRAQPKPVSLTLALLLSQVSGLHGEAVFGSIWCRLLDLTAEQAHLMAIQAHREGLLNLRSIGSVVEITFPRFQPHLEEVK